MDAFTAASRHVRGAAATLPMTWDDETGDAADAGGAVTVRVQKADGTDIIAAGSATVHPATGEYTRALTAAQCAELGLLTATWTDASTGATRVTLHELVGGFYMSEAAARAWDPTGLDFDRMDRDIFLRARRQVEDECERITGVAWVPRYRRTVLDGTGDSRVALPDAQPRTIRSIRIYSTATAYTALTADQLAACKFDDDGIVTRVDGDDFPAGDANIVIEYEHGNDRPPEDLLGAVMLRLRDRITHIDRGVQERAETFQLQQGGTVRFAAPGLYSTGLPEVDGIYRRYSQRSSKIVSVGFDLDPSRGSLFHGGRR